MTITSGSDFKVTMTTGIYGERKLLASFEQTVFRDERV